MTPVIGIITEYNPFHNGHAWHIGRSRELVPKAPVVCVMSGHVTQRGTFAICRKQARAEMALRGGADLVLELPAPYACASAERFAQAGVALLQAAGVVTHLSFGSEAGTLAPLTRAAGVLDSPAFLPAQAEAYGLGLSYPAARQRAYETLTGETTSVLARPNDILGLEYLLALRRAGSDIEPVTVPRRGAGHDADTPLHGFASASYLRARLQTGEEAAAFVPSAAARIWAREQASGLAPVQLKTCETAVLAQLRRMGEADFAGLPDATEGLEHRLARAARAAGSLEELYTRTKTKRYTHARIRRLVMCAYAGLTGAPDQPPYLRVLAANRAGLALLAEMKKTAALPLLTKPASVRRMGEAAQQVFAMEALVTDLFALCYPARDRRTGGQEWTAGPVILDK